MVDARTTEWNHGYSEANGITVHHVRHGDGTPLVLLHGWPEFWYAYRKNIPTLAEQFDVVVPDLLGLADALELERFGLVSHDVGSFIAQAFARKHPERLSGLFFFNCVYPGIGKRWLEPETVKELWYQSFNQQPWAADLVGKDRDAVRTYFGHFLDNWASRPGFFEDDLEAWVENFMKPGNIQGGFNWYIGIDEARTEIWRHGAPELPKTEVPARFFWGEDDPLIKAEWADRLGDYFSDYSFQDAPGAGHFVHYKTPKAANREIAGFFSSL